MFLAALTSGWLVCLGVGILIGWALRRDDVERAYWRGYWSRDRELLATLQVLHDHVGVR